MLARYSYGAHDGPYSAAYALGAVWTDSRTVDSEVYSARHQCSYWNRIGYDWLTTEPADLARSMRNQLPAAGSGGVRLAARFPTRSAAEKIPSITAPTPRSRHTPPRHCREPVALP
ncbi:hypothetical protein M271_40355 [Streptomyces rapamycinicus NRRL 5491]|uniref:Uncharacterized protein n=1 Tax=Streptomyces rapamycinicus (strain ATCC 29253 / DSM 41530 / NRRL 5491 / AYB-994) TaxID=1343740 RepID=A0A0A0NQF2_STRRN|nr:hypothetical protein M271_40355 [Streptomyces rapamycinicus NRRL 5491]RLV77356.1 hypothetical protein D3C57_103265 [Streptomyces rapamycinicus NRRL 5491]